jgi:hypothetical protein
LMTINCTVRFIEFGTFLKNNCANLYVTQTTNNNKTLKNVSYASRLCYIW